METITIYRSQFATAREFRAKFAELKKAGYAGYVKVDDGEGGTGYKFFESHDDLRVWKQQK